MKGKLYIFVLCILLTCSCARSLESTDIIGPGDPLPSFSVKLSDGHTVTTDSLRGAPALLIFFNTHCGTCRKELPRLQKLHRSIPLRMLAIGREESDQSIRRFWQENGLTIPYAPQAGRRIYNQFAIRYIPRLYLTDSTGRIHKVFRSTTRNRQIRKEWKRLTRHTMTPPSN